MKFFKAIYGVWASVLVGMVALSACTANPVKEAETFEQKAYALYGTYVIFQEKAAELVQDTTVPEKVKGGLRAADRVAYPVAESLVDAAVTVSDIRSIIEDCKDLTLPETNPACTPSNERRLANAITNLGTIYYKAQPIILNMVAAVKGVK